MKSLKGLPVCVIYAKEKHFESGKVREFVTNYWKR